MKSQNSASKEDVDAGLFQVMRRRFETRMAIAVLAGLGLIWALLGVVEWVNPGFVARLDAGTLRILRQGPGLEHVIGPSAVEHATLQLTAMGGSSVVIVWVALLMGYFVLSDRMRHAAHLGIATVGGAGLGWTFKYLVQRPRPEIVPHLMPETSWSFPSGHATITMVVFMTLAMMLANYCPRRIQKWYVMIAALGLVFLTGWTRLAMGVHYPTDVLAGWTLGLTWVLGAWMVGYALEKGVARGIGIAGEPPEKVSSTDE